MSSANLAVKRTDDAPQVIEVPGGKEPRASVPGGAWTVGFLSSLGTLVLAYLLSPGLRSDVNGLVALFGNVDASGITDWVLSFGAWSPIVYLFIMVGQVIASPIPAGPVALAGALIFGVWQGLALALTGSMIGSVLVFAAARWWGEPLVVRLVGEKVYRKYIGTLDARGWWLFAILLLPFMPDDAVVALAGLSAISYRRFLVVMVVGRIPGNTMTALLASNWVTSSAVTWISVGATILMILTLGFVYKDRLESWMFRRTRGVQARDNLAVDSRQKDAR